MNTYTVTITSKNQITLPAKLVRQLDLHKNRRLEISQRGQNLTLKPEPTFEERMKPIWDKIARERKNKVVDTRDSDEILHEIFRDGKVI